MEEKKVLHDEKMEDVSGGRELTVKEFSALDPVKKEEYLRTAKKLNLKSFEIPKELLDKVSGGNGEDQLIEVWDYCPNCGEYLYGHVGNSEYGIVFDYLICKFCGYFSWDTNFYD